MVLRLSDDVERLLQDLATKAGRNPDAIAEEAIRTFAEMSEYGDLTSEEVGETQLKLLGGIHIEPWDEGDAPR